MAPRLPASLDVATSPNYDLDHEATYRRVAFSDLDLSGQHAESAEFEECRFSRATLAGAVLERAAFTDCAVVNSDWANLRATKSTLVRAHFQAVRLTGVHWIDGGLRDVAYDECRMDLATFRFTAFKDVTFTGCNLIRADFTNADLRGAHFVDCDLTGAQFAQADCAGARFTRCDLSGIGSVPNLRGATITADDVAVLSHLFASALGIVITEA